ncbi:RNA polymerase, sigma-24 subunit, ECF subfamily [Pseudopedobacter saltans DSM 12145]|uniref:RNA polymerase, sigma-24 subunit, ECF subfamily n=1 Tax=Pseudopedobacter saltans (strain ATCC 51119 / DSM 12145 / JCM 21818 / CCUG 39354 / LMG 10337 / NBRC 100064 / NCIMB 13643) TaxID=762903 RepID=F0SCJ9_PSESL|nr:RNA polymerase sigma-70 factor [Pseudopedobacter saltans]ADY52833.1 RNA polymerase, sigma-24 subunit, ECF subfamily [Pseudopedobacter saltans DSM 12145]
MQPIDKKSFEILFRTHYKLLCKTSYRIIGDADEAEDIVQQVFCLFWEQRDVLEIRQSALAYLSKWVINHSLNRIRANGNRTKREFFFGEKVYQDRNYTEEFIMLKELNAKVDRVIDELPHVCRLVFILSRYEKLSYKEIGEKLNISVKTVENHMVKALKHIRKHLSIVALIFFYLSTRGNLF